MIEQGPFQAISFQSYQSKEINISKQKGLFNIGGEYNLDIHVFRNSNFNSKWKTYKKYSIKNLFSQIMSGRSRGFSSPVSSGIY
jgi:hypothetical protein